MLKIRCAATNTEEPFFIGVDPGHCNQLALRNALRTPFNLEKGHYFCFLFDQFNSPLFFTFNATFRSSIWSAYWDG